MARYSDTLVDQFGRPIQGASVAVIDAATDTLAALTSDTAGTLTNPFETTEAGTVVFNTTDGVYDLVYRFGGKIVREDYGVAIGVTLPQGVIADALGSGTAVAPSQRAVNAGLLTKPDRYPTNAYSPLQAGYARALAGFNQNFFDASSNHMIPTDGGGINFGLASPTLPAPSMWQMWGGFNVLYEAWRLASGADKTALAAQIAGQWAYIKASYSAANLRTGNGGIVNTMDDGAWHAMGLYQVVDFYGASATEGALALGYLIEFIPYLTSRFHDPLQTGTDYINYGVSTPTLATAFRSDRYGILYSAATDTASVQAGGYASSSFEAGVALVAALASQISTVSAQMRAALLSYAQNVWAFAFTYLRTPAPANATRSAQGLYAAGFNLDPNVNANNNSAVNGGAAQSGRAYDTNQVYHQPVDAYFGKPVRALTHLWDSACIGMGALSAVLYRITGTTSYATEALHLASAFIDAQGFGRPIDGLPGFGNLRDPHSAGYFWPIYLREASAIAGFDPSNAFRIALLNTARRIAWSSQSGFITPNWGGAEKSQDGSVFWEDTSARQALGGGGQAKREQIMVTTAGLSLIQAAMQFASQETALGSGVNLAAAIEMLPLLVSALRMQTEESLSRLGGNLTGPVSVKDQQFRLDNLAGNPFMAWDSNDLVQYDRTNNRWLFSIGNTVRGYVDATGFHNGAPT